MKILVTGAAGFLGSNVARRLSTHHDVVGNDIVNRADAWRLEGVPLADYLWKQLEDLESPELFGLDAVVHCAASSNVAHVWNSPRFSLHQTLAGTLHLLNLALDLNGVRFVNISTHSVYGPPAYNPVNEAHSRRPSNLYGALKLGQEGLVHAYHSKGLDYVTLRMTTMYGVQDRRGATIYEILYRALTGQGLFITGDGSQTRDFNFVDNAVLAIEKVVEEGLDLPSREYNIGSGESTSIAELVGMASTLSGQLTGKLPEVEHKPPRPGEEGEFRIDIDKARFQLGYEPKVRFAEGLERMAKWIISKHNLVPSSSLKVGPTTHS